GIQMQPRPGQRWGQPLVLTLRLQESSATRQASTIRSGEVAMFDQDPIVQEVVDNKAPVMAILDALGHEQVDLPGIGFGDPRACDEVKRFRDGCALFEDLAIRQIRVDAGPVFVANHLGQAALVVEEALSRHLNLKDEMDGKATSRVDEVVDEAKSVSDHCGCCRRGGRCEQHQRYDRKGYCHGCAQAHRTDREHHEPPRQHSARFTPVRTGSRRVGTRDSPGVCRAKHSPSIHGVEVWGHGWGQTSSWAPISSSKVGAGDGLRTRYLDLGKVALYQVSYSRSARATILPGRAWPANQAIRAGRHGV